jgi:hypothetical protein
MKCVIGVGVARCHMMSQQAKPFIPLYCIQAKPVDLAVNVRVTEKQ